VIDQGASGTFEDRRTSLEGQPPRRHSGTAGGVVPPTADDPRKSPKGRREHGPTVALVLRIAVLERSVVLYGMTALMFGHLAYSAERRDPV